MPQRDQSLASTTPGFPVRPNTLEEAISILRHRAQLGRIAGLEYFASGPLAQAALGGIAGQLEEIADFLENQ